MSHDGARGFVLLLATLLVTSALSVGCVRARPLETWATQCAPGSYAPQSLDRWFRLTSDVIPGRRGPHVEGYVYNDFGVGAERMRLAVDRVDGADRTVDCVTISVPGAVPPAGRAYFTADVPDASARYRVRILSFDWANKGGP
jgi:hypothetical protein